MEGDEKVKATETPSIAPETDGWTCPQCGTENDGNFCFRCGGAKPEATAADATEPVPGPAARRVGKEGRVACSSRWDPAD